MIIVYFNDIVYSYSELAKRLYFYNSVGTRYTTSWWNVFIYINVYYRLMHGDYRYLAPYIEHNNVVPCRRSNFTINTATKEIIFTCAEAEQGGKAIVIYASQSLSAGISVCHSYKAIATLPYTAAVNVNLWDDYKKYVNIPLNLKSKIFFRVVVYDIDSCFRSFDIICSSIVV